MPNDGRTHADSVPKPDVERQVRIAAGPALVFQFLTDPERLTQWMGPPASWDARPGGALKIAIDGVHPVSGSFVEVDPPRRIVFTWGWELPEYGVAPGGSTVEINLTADGDGTLLRLRHLGLPGDPDENIEGWMPYLERLNAAVMAANPTREDQDMSERAAALASAFEQANDALIAAVEGCTDEQVQQICDAEGWSVAVAAHHVAASYGSLGGLAQLLANGQDVPAITMDMIHAANAQHADEFASVGRDETVAELRTQGAAAAAVVRSLTDEQLDKSAPMAFAGGASWSTADIIERILIGHPLDHGKSIQAALTRPVTA